MSDTTATSPGHEDPYAEDREQVSESQMKLAALADRYVRSKMTDQEREDFELQLMDDQEALIQVELAIALSEGVAANRAELPIAGTVRDVDMPSSEASGSPEAVATAGWFPWAVAMAASVGLVAVTADRAALLADQGVTGFAVEQQVLLSPYRSTSDAAADGVPITKVVPPAEGGILLEIRLPRPLVASLPTGAPVRARLIAEEGSRLILDQDVSVLRGYALIGVDAERLRPGRYEVSLTAPADAEIVRYTIDVQAPGAVDDAETSLRGE